MRALILFGLCAVISITLTAWCIDNGYSMGIIFLTNILVGGILGFIAGLMGYEA
jgi:hypothetical protein